MLDLTLPEFFAVCGSVLLATLLLSEIFDWTSIFAPLESQLPITAFGASNAWKILYPESVNGNETAIDIETRHAVVVQPSEPLVWTGYCSKPTAMAMANNGNTVTITGFWSQDNKPSIQGGPLSESYDFHSMIFHWGANDEVGSEHTVDNVNFPLELQMIHVKRGFDSPFDAIVVGAKHGVAIVSIFFQIANTDNQYLDHVVKYLWRTPRPGMNVCIPPFPLEEMFTPFEKNYYSYCGALLQESCNEAVTWIVQPQPMNVSSSQMGKFRSIYLADVPMLFDGRPIDRLNDRDLYYHD